MRLSPMSHLRKNRPKGAPSLPTAPSGADDVGLARTAGIAARVGPERAGAILRGSQVAMAFEALGDRWSALVMREIFLGARRFEEFVAATGASRATLTLRLRALVEQGILHRHPYQTRPTRFEYRLTRIGMDLYPTALMYWLWERRYSGGSGLPKELVHKTCGHSMLPLLVCRSCSEPLSIGDVRVEIVAEPDEHQVSLPQHYLHSGRNSWRGGTGRSVRVIDVIGDRWTALVQAATYYGLHRFADIQTALAVPTNTLSDRLRLLVQAGVFRRTPYQEHPPRYAYRLTEKGRALYLPAITLHQWANRWLLRGRAAPIRLLHRPCGNVVDGAVVCDQCREELQPAEVTMRRPLRRTEASPGRTSK
ncbi:MAG TPA: helix-turn-helix domain-containing protein [Steroidobacteraceae bacterium]